MNHAVHVFVCDSEAQDLSRFRDFSGGRVGERFGIINYSKIACVWEENRARGTLGGNEVEGADVTGALGVLVSLNQSTDT